MVDWVVVSVCSSWGHVRVVEMSASVVGTVISASVVGVVVGVDGEVAHFYFFQILFYINSLLFPFYIRAIQPNYNKKQVSKNFYFNVIYFYFILKLFIH